MGLTDLQKRVLVRILVYHYRTRDAGCGCGWGELGESHAEHVAQVYHDCLRNLETFAVNWGDIQNLHHGRRVFVWADSTPEDPENGSGVYEGFVEMPNPLGVPTLHCTSCPDKQPLSHSHTFAPWFKVASF